MHRMILLAMLVLGHATGLHGQNATIGCGDPMQAGETLAAFGPLFTSQDSAYVTYRTRNGLQQVSASEVFVVSDSTVCASLASRGAELLATAARDDWCTSRWETYFIKAGPYYYIYLAETPPEGTVGGGWYEFVLDAATLANIPLTYAVQW